MATPSTSGSSSSSAAVSQTGSISPSKGAGSNRTHASVVTAFVAVGSSKVRSGPARSTVEASSVNVAIQVPSASSTTVRGGSSIRTTDHAGSSCGAGGGSGAARGSGAAAAPGGPADRTTDAPTGSGEPLGRQRASTPPRSPRRSPRARGRRRMLVGGGTRALARPQARGDTCTTGPAGRWSEVLRGPAAATRTATRPGRWPKVRTPPGGANRLRTALTRPGTAPRPEPSGPSVHRRSATAVSPFGP
jgi:hypothetical protein